MNRLIVVCLLFSAAASAQTAPDAAAARDALRRAVAFFRTEVSVQGGYLWAYTSDLTLREGENAATATQAWVQPPGTPAIGLAYLRAYERVGETYLLEAATETALALVRGQLQSGGWHYRIDYEDSERHKTLYRKPPAGSEGFNTTTLDDDTTQAALRFLIVMDKALGQRNEPIHEAARYALDALLATQYPNGAWPQRFKAPPDPAQSPVRQAAYPESWPREFPDVQYTSYYTFNDNSICDTMEVMLGAWEAYGDERYRASALKAGDFMLLAQMPDPQPAWAQQYNQEMHPAWARKFEPPAISGRESQSIIKSLLVLAARTGEVRFLAPIPRALAYLRSSLLPDGRLARFYELQTNKPLYCTRDYVLTYDGSDVPTHYSFYAGSQLDALQAHYELAKAGKRVEETPPKAEDVARAAQEAVDSLDPRGAWVSAKPLKTTETPPNTKTIRSADFIRNLDALSTYLDPSPH
jgi:PelA/Pel-15E family pectate lyase